MDRASLLEEVKRLRNAIRKHRDSSGHELCWHHPDLWSLLPEQSKAEPVVPEWPQFLRGCVKYRGSLDRQPNSRCEFHLLPRCCEMLSFFQPNGIPHHFRNPLSGGLKRELRTLLSIAAQQADRSPTAGIARHPKKGLWSQRFYHDGRFANLRAVIMLYYARRRSASIRFMHVPASSVNSCAASLARKNRGPSRPACC